MGSTYAELFAEFNDDIKSYTEKLDVTELSFMRTLSQGMKLFQRGTKLLEKAVNVTKALSVPYYTLPVDTYQIKMINEINSDGTEGATIVMQDLSQQYHNMQTNSYGYGSTPRNNDLPLHNGYNFYTNNKVRSRTFSIYNRNIVIEPDYPDSIAIYYYLDFPAFSQPDSGVDDIFNYWKDWYPINSANFATQFVSQRMPYDIAPYEKGILSYAVSEYLKRKNSQNFIYYKSEFEQEIQYAKDNKQCYHTEMYVDYNISPYS